MNLDLSSLIRIGCRGRGSQRRQRYIHRYICKFWLMNKICYDSSKFVNAEIEFSGADNETRIVVTRIRGSESDRSSLRFCEV